MKCCSQSHTNARSWVCSAITQRVILHSHHAAGVQCIALGLLEPSKLLINNPCLSYRWIPFLHSQQCRCNPPTPITPNPFLEEILKEKNINPNATHEMRKKEKWRPRSLVEPRIPLVRNQAADFPHPRWCNVSLTAVHTSVCWWAEQAGASSRTGSSGSLQQEMHLGVCVKRSPHALHAPLMLGRNALRSEPKALRFACGLCGNRRRWKQEATCSAREEKQSEVRSYYTAQYRF